VSAFALESVFPSTALDLPLRGFEGALELRCGLLAHESQARIYSEIGGEYPMVAFQVCKPLDLLMRNHRLKRGNKRSVRENELNPAE
jgi:hypothetical protein